MEKLHSLTWFDDEYVTEAIIRMLCPECNDIYTDETCGCSTCPAGFDPTDSNCEHYTLACEIWKAVEKLDEQACDLLGRC